MNKATKKITCFIILSCLLGIIPFAAGQTNYIPNPGFESVITEAYGDWGNSDARYHGDAHTGEYCLEIYKIEGDQQTCFVNMPYVTAYALGFWAKYVPSDETPNGVMLEVTANTLMDYNIFNVFIDSTTYKFYDLSSHLLPDQIDQFGFEIPNGYVGTVHIDDVNLQNEVFPTVTPSPAPTVHISPSPTPNYTTLLSYFRYIMYGVIAAGLAMFFVLVLYAKSRRDGGK